MKIINIVPGFGGSFYCGNCLRDSAFTKSLKESGHEAITLPLYMPLNMQNNLDDNDMPIFYGAVNVYLEQKFKIFRNMPKWLHDFFNSKPILRYAAKKSGSTRADGLEGMTISMLKGAEGYQKEELDALIDYLKHHEKPDVVHLSNALLMGLAAKIKEELNIPVICSLQDEDVWVDAMHDDAREKVWRVMCEKSRDIDSFVAVSQFFADVMKTKMCIPDEKLHIIPIGIDPKMYEVSIPVEDPPVVGYLSRMNDENGFEVFVDAFIELKKNSKFTNVKMKASGGKTGDDKKFINKQIKKLKKNGFMNDVEFVDDFRTEKLSEFFSDLTVLSVPVLKGEAFGMYQLESMACGVPIVQPDLGAFPEVVEATGGGVIYKPNTPLALADKFVEVLSDYTALNKMSIKGRESVVKKFDTYLLTQRMMEVYKSAVEKTNVNIPINS